MAVQHLAQQQQLGSIRQSFRQLCCRGTRPVFLGPAKICLTAIEDSAGWRTRWRVLVSRVGRRDGNDQRLLNSRAVVKCTEARRVVRDPPG